MKLNGLLDLGKDLPALQELEAGLAAGRAPAGPLRVSAKIRYRAREQQATVEPLADGARGAEARVRFDEPLRGITPGQAVVFYQGEICLGGGIIAASTN